MTVKRECEDSSLYYQLDFVEFLEMIARVADNKFKNTPQDTSLTLSEKIEWVLNMLLPLVKSSVVRLNLGALEETESDNDY